MQITTSYCDFSSQVPQHQAHFQIVAKGKGETDVAEMKGGLRLDACSDHVCRMMSTLFHEIDTPAQEVIVRRIPSVPLPDPNELTCSLCSNGKEFASEASLAAHRRNTHGIRVR